MAAVKQSYKCVDQCNNKKAYCNYDESMSADVVAKVSTGVYRAHLVNTKTVLPLHYGEPIRRHQYPMQHFIKPNEQILQIPITIKNVNNAATSPSYVQQIPISIIETDNKQQTKSKDYALNDNFNEIYKKNLRKLSTNERQRQLFFKNRPENSNQSSPVMQQPGAFTATTPNMPHKEQRFDLQPNAKYHQRDIPSAILSKLSTFAVNVQQKKAQMFNNRSSGANAVAVTSLLNNKHYNNGLGINMSPTSTYTTSSTNSPASSPTSSITSINNLNLNTTESNKPKAPSQTWFYDESDDFWYSLKDEKKSKLKLTKINLKSLNIIELIHLKQICLAKLQRSLNNFHIAMPKDESIKSTNKSSFKLRSKSVDYKLALYDDLKSDNANTTSNIFGQSLYKTILIDANKKKKQIYIVKTADIAHTHDNLIELRRNSGLFDALDLTALQHMFNQDNSRQQQVANSNGSQLVPNIIRQSCEFIEKYGLDIVGIFRIDSSKKRIKEIRDQLDSGKLNEFNIDEHSPLDVACLLKEYLRCLPEPLLTRKLYSAFIACNKIKDPIKKIEAIKCLICLLPVPNRDTLYCILKLLDRLRSHCFENQQQQKSGNKMDSFNLAMIFGPNILQKRKINSNKEYSIDKNALIDDIDSVISMTKYLIENQKYLFYIESELHNEILQKVNESHANEMNTIMQNKIANCIGIRIYGSGNSNNGSDSDSNNTDSSGYSSLLTNFGPKKNDSSINTKTRTISTPSSVQLSTHSPLYLTMQCTTKKPKEPSANRNVYVKNRAYFPISHMNKNLINNLNEENKKPKNHLLMISNDGLCCAKTKSLTNLNANFETNERDRLHFIGEQETLV